MIYSIIPYDQMFFNSEDNRQERMEVNINGEKVVLLKNDNNTYTIERLISTNPKAYLNPDFMPGTVIMTVTSKKESPNVKWETMNNDFRCTQGPNTD